MLELRKQRQPVDPEAHVFPACLAPWPSEAHAILDAGDRSREEAQGLRAQAVPRAKKPGLSVHGTFFSRVANVVSSGPPSATVTTHVFSWNPPHCHPLPPAFRAPSRGLDSTHARETRFGGERRGERPPGLPASSTAAGSGAVLGRAAADRRRSSKRAAPVPARGRSPRKSAGRASPPGIPSPCRPTALQRRLTALEGISPPGRPTGSPGRVIASTSSTASVRRREAGSSVDLGVRAGDAPAAPTQRKASARRGTEVDVGNSGRRYVCFVQMYIQALVARRSLRRRSWFWDRANWRRRLCLSSGSRSVRVLMA